MASIKLLLLMLYLFASGVAVTLSETEGYCVRKKVPNRDSRIAYLLRLQWLPGQCVAIGDDCAKSRVEDSIWTIHGLWAARDCTGDHEFRGNALPNNVKDELDKYWINIKNEGDNEEFWECEYKKHGCATNWKQNEYFTKAIHVYQKYNPGPQLTKVGVTPGGSYSSAKLESAFDTIVQLKCNKDNSINELEFCLDHKYKAIDCDEDKHDACNKDKDILYLTENQEKSPNENKKIKMRRIW